MWGWPEISNTAVTEPMATRAGLKAAGAEARGSN
jgi:hypothetical protein